MIIGLARTSTLEQIAGLEAQVRDLEAYGCKRIFKEQVSSIAEREQLEAALNTLREGDKLVCTKLDRLARSVQHLGLTAINSDDTKKTFKAFRSQSANGSPEKKMTDGQLSAMLHQLAQKHEPIAHKLASGAGIDLMYVDSQITEKLIEKFTYVYKCPILTVHDSYIVPFGYDHFLYQEMQAAFEEVTGVTHPVVEHTTEYFDVIEQEPHPDNPVDPQHDHYAVPPSQRHLSELELFRRFKGKPLWEDWVPDWTAVY